MSIAAERAGPRQRLPGGRSPWATHHVLVEVVHHHPGQPRVAPVAVHEQQLLEVTEAGDGKVAGHDGLRGRTETSASVPAPVPGCQGLPQGRSARGWVRKTLCHYAVTSGASVDSDSPSSPLENPNLMRLQQGQARRDQWSSWARFLSFIQETFTVAQSVGPHAREPEGRAFRASSPQASAHAQPPPEQAICSTLRRKVSSALGIIQNKTPFLALF